MAEKKPKKGNLKIATREPQKPKAGIFDDLGKGRQQGVKHPLREILNLTSDENNEPTDLPTIIPTNIPTNEPTLSKSQPIAPEKDFARIPNSIKRAVEAGHFPNSSLAIYLYLYSLTRGAIKPKRSIRVNKTKLLSGANLRAEKALLKNLAHLKNLGFVKITIFNGDHLGNEYEVFVPEEIEGDLPTYLPTKQPAYLITGDTPVPTVQRSVGRLVETTENQATYDVPKTSFKDNVKSDDEAFAPFIEKFQKACEQLTGKQLSKRDSDKLSDLADLLILELKTAARRTDSISSVPAFLTEVLRRQFFAARQQQSVSKSSKLKKDTVGKPEADSYEIKPLDEQGREEALAQLREFTNDDFLEDFKKWYTTEDWEWLKANLSASDR